MYSANSCSNRLARGPVVIQPPFSVSTTSAISSSSMHGRWKGSQVARNGSPPFSARRSAIIASSCRLRPSGPPIRAFRPARLAEQHQLVRPQQRDRLQQLAEQPAPAGQRPRERRDQRHAASVDREPGEEGDQLGGSQRTGVPPVSRHTEVVGYHDPARPEHARHLAGDGPPHPVVQDRGEDGELADQVEAARPRRAARWRRPAGRPGTARSAAPPPPDPPAGRRRPGSSGRRPSSPAAAGSRRRRTPRPGCGTRRGPCSPCRASAASTSRSKCCIRNRLPRWNSEYRRAKPAASRCR